MSTDYPPFDPMTVEELAELAHGVFVGEPLRSVIFYPETLHLFAALVADQCAQLVENGRAEEIRDRFQVLPK